MPSLVSLRWPLIKMHVLVRKFRITIWPLPSVTPSPTRLQALAALVRILQHHSFNDSPCQVKWRIGSSATYTVWSQYQLLLPLQPNDTAAKTLWNVAPPLKVKITTWLVVWDRLPTRIYLHRHHIRPQLACTFCINHPESTDHLLLFCDFTRRVWDPIVIRLVLSSWPTSLRNMWEDWRMSRIPLLAL